MTLDLDANTISIKLKENPISIKHKENDLNKGYLSISKQKGSYISSNKLEYVIEFKKDFLNPLDENNYFSVVSLPFIFNKADMTFNYYLEKDRPVICAIYNTSVDNLFINIYSRSNLIEEDEIV
jgi:hypothetical protein